MRELKVNLKPVCVFVMFACAFWGSNCKLFGQTVSGNPTAATRAELAGTSIARDSKVLFKSDLSKAKSGDKAEGFKVAPVIAEKDGVKYLKGPGELLVNPVEGIIKISFSFLGFESAQQQDMIFINSDAEKPFTVIRNVNSSGRLEGKTVISENNQYKPDFWHKVQLQLNTRRGNIKISTDGKPRHDDKTAVENAKFAGLKFASLANISDLSIEVAALPPVTEAEIKLRGEKTELEKKIKALTETNAEERLKKAVLVWALEETAALAEAGMFDRAVALLEDVRTGLSRPLGQRRTAPENLFPKIPVPERNPALQFTNELRKLVDSTERYPKGKAGDVTKTAGGGWRFPKIAGEGRLLAEWLCHPQSPLADDATLVAPMLRRFSAVYEYLVPGSSRLADFGMCSTLEEMYLLVKTVYPDLILPSLKVRWEAGIACNADAVIAKCGSVFLAAEPGTAYPNAHAHYITGLMFSSLILDRSDYRAAADGGVRLLATALFPDGGFTYIGKQNEVFTYHAVTVLELARYWQVTGSETARRVIEGTRWYYPLSIEPGGVAEYSTAAAWKHYWNTSTGGEASAVVASLTGDPQNARFANWKTYSLSLAAFYREDLPAVSAPDNYITHDRNIQGPRGRFGAFSFCGTGRASPGFVGKEIYDRNAERMGKSTYVGCMAMYPPGGQSANWPLSAALDGATSEVRIAPGDGGVSRWDTYAFLSQDDHNATTVNPSFAALTTRYRLSAKGELIPWAGEQAWIFTPERLIGLVAVEALEDTEAYGVDGTLKLVSARGHWGTRKEFKELSTDTLGYGALVVRLHQHNYSGITTEYTGAIFGNDGKSGRIILLEAQAAAAKEAKLIKYSKGTRHFYLVEVRPEWSKQANVVQQSRNDNGLIMVEVRESDRTLQLVYNPTDKELSCKADPLWASSSVTLHRNGEAYRVAWLLNDQNAEAPTFQQFGDLTRAVSVPAHGHIVFEAK